MKKHYFFLFLFSLTTLFFQWCKTTVDNRISFNNLSGSDLIINFRGQDIKVDIGKKVDINEIPKGTYTYATIFSIPVGATPSSTFGEVSGSVNIKAKTKILIIHTSTLLNGIFTLTATFSSSDDQTNPTSPSHKHITT